jgi:hypothetical protein
MPLMLPADFKNIASDDRHPWFRPEAHDPNLVIFLDGEPCLDMDIVEASETNGFVKILKKGRDGNYLRNPRHPDKLDTVRLKGKVQFFIRKENPNVS